MTKDRGGGAYQRPTPPTEEVTEASGQTFSGADEDPSTSAQVIL